MLSFYNVDAVILIIISITSFASYKILEYKFKNLKVLYNLLISLLLGILVSIMYSYLTIESDELLTTNFWE